MLVKFSSRIPLLLATATTLGCGSSPVVLGSWTLAGTGAQAGPAPAVMAASQAEPAGSDRNSLLLPSARPLRGIVAAPVGAFAAGNLVPAGGGSLIPLGGGSVMANNGGNLTPSTGGAFTIQALDIYGGVVAGTKALVAGPDGRFTLSQAKGVRFIEARRDRQLFSAYVPAEYDGDTELVLTPASTMVTEYVREQLKVEKLQLSMMDPRKVDRLIKAVADLLGDRLPLVDLSNNERAAASFERVVAAEAGAAELGTTLVEEARKAPVPAVPGAGLLLEPTAAMIGTTIVLAGAPEPSSPADDYVVAVFNGSKTKATLTRKPGGRLEVVVPNDAKNGPIGVFSNGTVLLSPHFEVSAVATELASYPGPYKPIAFALLPNGDFWTSSQGENVLTKFSAQGAVLVTSEKGERAPQQLWLDGSGRMWGYQGGVVQRFAPETGETLKMFSVKVPWPWGGAVVVGLDGTVWMSEPETQRLSHFDETGKVIGNVTVGRRPTVMAVGSNGDLWVANEADGTVSHLDAAGQAIGTYGVGTVPAALGIDRAGNAWVWAKASKTLMKLSPAGEALWTVPYATDVKELAFDSRGQGWLSTGSSVTRVRSNGKLFGVLPDGGAMMIDRDDHLWLSKSDGFGVREMRPN